MQKRNYFDQHADNHRKTVRLNILLPLIILIVVPALYFLALVISAFSGAVKIKSNASLVTLATLPRVWLLTVILMVIWYGGILLYTRYQLNDSIDKVMSQVHATKIDVAFGKHYDLKQQMLVNVVSELAIAYGIERPAVYVIEDTQELNALAVGDRQNSGVAITQPLLEKLNRSELSGVMGHELGHVANEDSQVILRFISYVVGLSVLVVIGQLLYRIGFQSGVWRSDDDDDDDSSSNTLTLLLGLGGALLILLGYIARWAAIILRFAMSRTREYDADAMSAQINQSPAGLISALSKLDAAAFDVDDDDERSKKKRKPGRYAALYFADDQPDKHSLFDDHSTIDARIKRLKEL